CRGQVSVLSKPFHKSSAFESVVRRWRQTHLEVRPGANASSRIVDEGCASRYNSCQHQVGQWKNLSVARLTTYRLLSRSEVTQRALNSRAEEEMIHVAPLL